MAKLRVHSDRLEVQLTPTERALGLRSDDIVIRRDDISSATLTDDPWIWLRGIRRRGTAIPLVVAVGTWKSHAGTDFVLVKGKGHRHAVVFELTGGEFTRLIVSTSHGPELIERVRVDPVTEGSQVIEG